MFLGLANALAVLACIYAVWIRRMSFGSRWDAPLTVGVALYAAASALDAPWPDIAASSYPFTGKYYLLNTVGHICFLAGNAAGLRSVFMRLLPDDEIGTFMGTLVKPVVAIAATVMLVCVSASPITSAMPAHYLYAVPLDGWLRLYFCVYFLTMTATLWLAVFGGVRINLAPPGPGPAVPLLATATIGSVACLGFLTAILNGRADVITTLWPLAYLTTTAAALTCAFAWRRRMATLNRREQKP